MHGDSLEISSAVAGWLEACGFELGCDVVCGALVGFGAGVTAFHGVVGEGNGLGHHAAVAASGFCGDCAVMATDNRSVA